MNWSRNKDYQMDNELKRLDNLTPAKGSNRPKKRLGRGPGSGLGKTSGKGHKGQKARKGGKITPGFEGGQMPLYRRLPKRGFKNPFRVEYNAINIELLNKFENGTAVTVELLKKSGFVKKPGRPVKLLGRGTLEKSLTVSVDKFSVSAREAIEKAGGKIEES
jgi:large subunit ribosomal protein L15